MKIENILLTTDFSDAAKTAYPVAASVARKFGATIHLVNFAEALPSYHLFGGAQNGASDDEEIYLEQLEAHLTREAGVDDLAGLTVRAELLKHGVPHEALCDFVKDRAIDLVTLATQGRSGLGYLLVGSFAEKIVRHSPASVLTCHVGEARPFSPRDVVVPIDFSENSKAVLPAVRFLATNYSCRFTFIHALEPFSLIEDLPLLQERTGLSRSVRQAPRLAAEIFAELRRTELAGIDCELQTVSGQPFQTILEHCEKTSPDLIVLATHGWSGVRHYFLGSVAEKLVRKAPCPMLTVRSPGAGE